MDKEPKKILLIEDELFIRDLYLRVLVKAGFHVDVAEDGSQGLALANDAPDVILLDIMMPELNGIDVLKKLKSNAKTKRIPVLILTNLGQESIVQEAFKNGAAGYLIKIKLTPYDVVSQIKDFLANPNRKVDYQLDLD